MQKSASATLLRHGNHHSFLSLCFYYDECYRYYNDCHYLKGVLCPKLYIKLLAPSMKPGLGLPRTPRMFRCCESTNVITRITRDVSLKKVGRETGE